LGFLAFPINGSKQLRNQYRTGGPVGEFRVARWYTFIPKFQIWVIFYGPAMEEVGIFYGY
jgi:hypothetical protein